MKKRALSLLLALVMMFGLLPVTALAVELDNGLEYEVYEDHVEITGYTGDGTEVVIPAEIEGLPVTSIGNYAFQYSDSPTSIDIPNSITYIGDYAFAYCYNLTGIHVDENNLRYSSDDRGVLFNKEKTELIQAPGAISGSYTLPNSVTHINIYAFDGCTKVTSIDLSDKLYGIADYSFNGCTNLSRIYIPDSVTYIGSHAFANCSNLTSINIPNSVTSIGDNAFYGCSSLSCIYIPESVTEIFYCAFCFCSSLSAIHVNENNLHYSSDDRGGYLTKRKRN